MENITTNTNPEVISPKNMLLIHVGINNEDNELLEEMSNKEIIDFFINNYDEALDCLIAFSEAEDYNIPEAKYLKETDGDFSKIEIEKDELIHLHCFIEIDGNMEDMISDRMLKNKPVIYVTSL